MGAIFEWYQASQDTAYPFKERQPDNLHLLFNDAIIYHNLERTQAYDLRIHACSLVYPRALELRFSDGTTLAYLAEGGAGVSFQTITFGEYTIFEWRRSTVNGQGYTDEDVVARIVVITARVSDFPGSFSPIDGTLVPSLVNPRVKRVRRLFVKRALTGEIDLVTHEKVYLEAGNNVEFALNDAPTDELTRKPTVVTVNAAPGLGAGAVYRCNETEGIKTINNIRPDDRGDYKLTGSLCSWFERPMRTPGPPIHPHTDLTLVPDDARWPYNAPTEVGPGLIMHQDCEACCACEDYVNAYRSMVAVWERAQAVSLRIQQLQETYNQICTMMNAGMGRIPMNVNGNLTVIARPDYHLACGFLVYNNSEAHLGTTELMIDVDQASSNIEYTAKSGYLDFGASNNFQVDPLRSVVGAGTRFKVVIAGLRMGAFVRFTLNLRFNSLLLARSATIITAQATATGSWGSTSDLQRMQLSPPTQKD